MSNEVTGAQGKARGSFVWLNSGNHPCKNHNSQRTHPTLNTSTSSPQTSHTRSNALTMSRQQYSQDTSSFTDSQMSPAEPSWQRAQPTIPGTVPGQHETSRIVELTSRSQGDFGAAPTQQRFDDTGCQGDGWDENIVRRQGIANQYAGSAGPTNVYASHAGQLGASGERDQFDSVGNMGGQDGRTHAGTREPVPPPPAMPQPGVNAAQPSTSDKLMGTFDLSRV